MPANATPANVVVLLRYADAAGLKLVAKHVATTCGIADSTAFAKIAKAKEILAASNQNVSAGPEAFQILLRYAHAANHNLVARHVATVAKIGQSTAFAKIAKAKEAIGVKSSASAGDSATPNAAAKDRSSKRKVAASPSPDDTTKRAAKAAKLKSHKSNQQEAGSTSEHNDTDANVSSSLEDAPERSVPPPNSKACKKSKPKSGTTLDHDEAIEGVKASIEHDGEEATQPPKTVAKDVDNLAKQMLGLHYYSSTAQTILHSQPDVDEVMLRGLKFIFETNPATQNDIIAFQRALG